MLQVKIKNKIIKSLEPLNPTKIILFGSYAYGKPFKDSDIDILIVTSDNFIPTSYNDFIQLKFNYSNALTEIRKNTPLDILVHTIPMHKKFLDNSSSFSKEIIKKGKVIYERND